MYVHPSPRQDEFYQKCVWVEHPLTSLPVWSPRRLSVLLCGWGGLLTSRMRNMWSGQGPASPLNCLAILILEFQSTGTESPIALLWGREAPSSWPPQFLLSQLSQMLLFWSTSPFSPKALTTFLYITYLLCFVLFVIFSSCFQSFPAPGSFQMSQFFESGGKSIGVSASASVLEMNIQDWFL